MRSPRRMRVVRPRKIDAVAESDARRPRPRTPARWTRVGFLHAPCCAWPGRSRRARRSSRIACSARTRPSLRVRRASTPLRIHTSSCARRLSKSALARASSASCAAFFLAVVVVVAGPARELAAVQVHDARGDPVHEAPVVADEQQRTAEFTQQRLQPFDGGDVQMVGGFIQQQQLGLHGQRARQQCAPPPATGEILVPRRRRRAPAAKAPSRRGLGSPSSPACPWAVTLPLTTSSHRGIGDGHDVLLQHGEARAGAQPDLAGIRQLRAAHQPQQRALALAVATDDADAFAGLDLQRSLREQRARAEGERDIVEAQDRRHGVTSRRTADGAILVIRGRFP